MSNSKKWVNIFVFIFIMALVTILPMANLLRWDEDGALSVYNEDFIYDNLEMDGVLILRLANNHKPDFPTSVACDYFASLVNERSDGRIVVETYHNALLGDEKSTIQQVAYGGIDMARVSISLLTDFDPDFISLQMPYLYEDSAHMWRVLDSDIGDTFLNSTSDFGFRGLCWYDAGARNFYTTSHPIRSADDLTGMKIRVQESNFMNDLIRQLGAEPVALPFEKVLQSLRVGLIDGAENNWPSYISTGHFTEAVYITIDEHIRIPEMIIINDRLMESLSLVDQQIILQAAKESSDYQRRVWQEQEASDMQRAKEKGCIIVEIENKDEFFDMVQPLYTIYGGGHEDLFERIKGMRGN